MAKKYESIQVAVPRETRIAKIAFASLFCIFGLWMLVGSLRSKNGDSGVLVFIGASILVIGAIGLIKFRATHEPQLTEQGKAVKAADEAAAKRRDDALGSFVGFVAAVCAVVYFAPAVFYAIGNEVRMYPISCPGWDYTSNKCPANKWIPLGVRHFNVHANQQIVIASYPDDNSPPERYYNCAVVDRLNWACTVAAASDSARVTMAHGVFVDNSVGDDPSLRYASRWRWWNIKWSQ